MPFPELAAKDALAELDRYRVIDVREPHEFHGPLGHVECAELVPLSTIEEHAARLDGSRPLLLICRSGKRSGQACEILQGAGIKDVTNLAGGMIGWNRGELPVRRSEPENLAALVDQVVAWVAQVGPLSIDAATDQARVRFDRQGVSATAPSHAAVEELITFFGESLAAVAPPDLELCLAAFRRSLAVL